MTKADIFKNIQEGKYFPGPSPTRKYPTQEIAMYKSSATGTWDELQKGIEEIEGQYEDLYQSKLKDWQEVREAKDTLFKNDVFKCFEVSGEKAEIAWNIIDRGYSTYEELIDDFEKLLPLIKYKES